jgi:hypothetical protein
VWTLKAYNNVLVRGTNTNTQDMFVFQDRGVISGTAYFANNTFFANDIGGAISCNGSNNWVVTARNNHVIALGSGITTACRSMGSSTVTESNTIAQTASAASAQGYVTGNNYAPTASGNATVDQGLSQSTTFTTDILGVTRPQGASWDVGAYEYSAGGPPASPLALVIQ